MGRPRKAIPAVSRTIQFPLDVSQALDIILYSPLEGRSPHGALSEYVVQAVREKLKRDYKNDELTDAGVVLHSEKI